MAHYKRGRRKNARAGCLLCHPYKANGQRLRFRMKGSDLRRFDGANAKLAEASEGHAPEPVDGSEENDDE